MHEHKKTVAIMLVVLKFQWRCYERNTPWFYCEIRLQPFQFCNFRSLSSALLLLAV